MDVKTTLHRLVDMTESDLDEAITDFDLGAAHASTPEGRLTQQNIALAALVIGTAQYGLGWRAKRRLP